MSHVTLSCWFLSLSNAHWIPVCRIISWEFCQMVKTCRFCWELQPIVTVAYRAPYKSTLHIYFITYWTSVILSLLVGRTEAVAVGPGHLAVVRAFHGSGTHWQGSVAVGRATPEALWMAVGDGTSTGGQAVRHWRRGTHRLPSQLCRQNPQLWLRPRVMYRFVLHTGLSVSNLHRLC